MSSRKRIGNPRSKPRSRALKETRQVADGTWTEMTEKQQQFCMAFMATFNISEAARMAGVTKPTATKWMKENKKIKSWLGKAKRKLFESREVDLSQLLTRINNVLHRDPAELVDEDGFLETDLRKIPKRMREQIEGIDQDVKIIYDEEGEEKGRQVKTRLRFTPSAPIMQLASEVLGLKETKGSEEVIIDWGGDVSEEEQDLVERLIEQAGESDD